MQQIADHPQRYALANELHARPFPVVSAPGRAAFLALKPAENAGNRDREAERAHLVALLDRFGANHPAPGDTHYFGQIGQHHLKWESHTEFVTYTIFGKGVADQPFDARTFSVFPDDWLAAAPGVRITSALVRIEMAENDAGLSDKLHAWFVGESLAVSSVLDDQLIIAADFRIDTAGHMRFAVFARPGTGDRRIGRVVQRICEIEIYKTMSMLGFARARDLGPQMGTLDRKLAGLVVAMGEPASEPAQTLRELLAVSAEVEKLVSQSAFRFGASGAYETIVNQRIAVLREARFDGRQTFAEFMMRRFDPAMRTVKSTEARLRTMADRAMRAGDLLRTRVDVERSAQNQALLESMDRRADLQLRLQKTVEGLSVVAISYYAVNLALYVLGPLEYELGVSKIIMAAVATPVVVVLVWLMVRRIRQHIE